MFQSSRIGADLLRVRAGWLGGQVAECCGWALHTGARGIEVWMPPCC